MDETKPVQTDMIGDDYLARPVGQAAPLVVVFPAWWGLNPFFKKLCDRLAEAGFAALGIDYYHGRIATTVVEAEQLRDGLLDAELVRRGVRDQIALLRSRGILAGEKIGTIGFSLGAMFAADLARRRPEVAALVLFYGVPGGKWDKTLAAVQGHFAESDPWGADAASVEKLRKRLELASVANEIYNYPHTGHWFFEEDRPGAYQPEAAHLAWERTVEFLKKNLL